MGSQGATQSRAQSRPDLRPIGGRYKEGKVTKQLK
jgi:hypothetical protein